MENYRQMEIVRAKEGIFSEFYCASYKILPSALQVSAANEADERK
jgi:hypothetical protein